MKKIIRSSAYQPKLELRCDCGCIFETNDYSSYVLRGNLFVVDDKCPECQTEIHQHKYINDPNTTNNKPGA